MSAAPVLAFGAAAAAVVAAWELLAAARVPVPARILAAVAALRAPTRPRTAAERADRRRSVALVAGCSLGAGWLLGGAVLAVATALAVPAALLGVGAAARARRRVALVEDAPQVARAMADALSGGHSVRGALGEVARRGGVGAAAEQELRAVAAALALGERTDAVLEGLRRRAGAPAYDALVAAVLLQREAGGDLAGLLRDLADALEHAAREARDARTMTAQARFTGLVVAALPLGAAALAELASPGWIASLVSEPIPLALLGVAAVLEAGGLLAVHRLGRSPA